MSRRIVFEASAFVDFNDWAETDKKIYKRIVSLLKDIDRSPFSGIGKPEPLKHDWQGYWSRRINHEHRLVYKVTDTAVVVAACRYHY
jgi:toxin YoeB